MNFDHNEVEPPRGQIISDMEMSSLFPREPKKESQQLFNYHDKSDPLQPIHPTTCCKPRKKLVDEKPIEEEFSTTPILIKNSRFSCFRIGEAEVIGDLSAFSIARSKGLIKSTNGSKPNFPNYFSTFSHISIQYLVAHIKSLDLIDPIVFITVGLSDQIHRYLDSRVFETSYREMLTVLKSKSVTDVIILVPPPYLRNETILDYEFYKKIREIVLSSKDEKMNFHLINFDSVFFQYVNPEFGIIGVRDGVDPKARGAKFINITVNNNAFTTFARSKYLYIHPNTAKEIEKRVREIVKIILKKKGVEKISDVQAFNEHEGTRFLYLRLSVGEIVILALADTGASMGVIRSDLCEQICRTHPDLIKKHKLTKTIFIRVADGDKIEVTTLVVIKFFISKNVQVYSYFLVVPELIQKIILGINFFRTYKVDIKCGSDRFRFYLPTGNKIEIPAVHCYDVPPKMEISEVSLEEFIQEDEDFIFADNCAIEPLIDKVQPLRSELIARVDQAVQQQVLSPQQANAALKAILPLAAVFGPETGRYKWGLIELDLVISERWVVKKYGTAMCYAQQIRDQLNEQLRAGLIVIGDSPWIHPIVVVPKPDGSIRICIDASALNSILTPMHHDTRRIESILYEPSVGPLFSSFDFSQGFLQLPLTEKSSKLLAFQFEGITYLPKTLPFGTSVSSSVFNKVVRSVIYRGEPFSTPYKQEEQQLVSEKWVRTYVDDILVQTPDFDTHMTQIEVMFQNILSSGMTLSLKKSQLFTRSTKFLGHTIYDGYFSKNLNKKSFFKEFEKKYLHDNILKFPSKRIVQRLVGFLNWFSRFIPNFATDVEPFLELVRSPPPLKTNDKHTQAYQKLKASFMSDFKLHRVTPQLPYFIKLNCEEMWATGCIFQRNEAGKSNIITMVSFRYPESAYNKVLEIRKYYSLYCTLTRYKDLLHSSRIVIDKELGGIVKKYREATEVNGVLAKWYVTIMSFHIDASGEQDSEFQQISTFLAEFIHRQNEIEQLPCESSEEACKGLLNLLSCSEEQESSSEISLIMDIQKQAMKLIPQLLVDQVTEALVNIKKHQQNDKFCQKMFELEKQGGLEKFIVHDNTLFKITSDEFWLLVIPQHLSTDLVRYLHQVYCHPGVLKTTLVFKRQFYFKGVDNLVISIVGECLDCKHNKSSNIGIEPTSQSTIVKEVGTLFVDHFGPLPVKKGGVQAVFVAMDRLSGFVCYQPVRSISADPTITAMIKVIDRFEEMKAVIHTVVSDNAPCFKSKKWEGLLKDRGIKMRKISPYNANANAVERQMRELGTGIRLRLNANNVEASSHRGWDSELRLLEATSNSLPKSHHYSPNQILGIEEGPRDPLKMYPVHCPDPIVLAKEKIHSIKTTFDSFLLSTIKIKTKLKFEYDDQGFVSVYTDGAAKWNEKEKLYISSFAIWFQPGHKANTAKVIEPGMTNNRMEIIAIIMAITTAIEYQIERLNIFTDSQYVASLWEEKELTLQNPRIGTYENFDLFNLLINAIGHFGEDNIKIIHVHGHTIDFGNLEVDYYTNRAISDCLKYEGVLKLAGGGDQRNVIMAYVAIHQEIEAEARFHKQEISGKTISKYQIGDIVTVKTHPLSQAGYGLTKKFFPKYSGQYRIIRTIGPNCYVLQNMENENHIVTTNIRQLALVKRES